ncbi:Ketopantoate reductase ApbA/PanE [Niveomyces insectorum RCEF 264]|uniref:Ketopantoate reductase ApbA/PanE n=1 Tax=Niveomyces insectorum RCEF 264 TaxID=1081102 RepID=A0A167UU06_9HYPO|nr:Ketopantoate reductase ApbA/PanE [Niveomyces insectorum RCEF 264]
MASGLQPEWLTRLLADNPGPGPKIYRQTVDDLLQSNDCSSRDLGSSVSSRGTCDAKNRAEDARRRIYILGAGNLGRLFAASLAKLPDRPPITLVVHRSSLLEQWHARPGLLLYPQSYLRDGARAEDEKHTRVTGVDVEWWTDTPRPRLSHDRSMGAENTTDVAELGRIENLIVATKAQDALPQVDWLRRYLGPGTTVAFLQNGMNKLWPPYGAVYNAARYDDDPPPEATGTGTGVQARKHPRWLACVVTHGVLSLGPFESVHASPAGVAFGPVDREPPSEVSGSYLDQQLLAAPQLQARRVSRSELWMLQLEKLMVNAVINPLTAILRCRNGDLFVQQEGHGDEAEKHPDIVAQIIDQLIAEASNVMQHLALYDTSSRAILGEAPDAAAADGSAGSGCQAFLDRLSFTQLRAMVYRVGAVVKDNTSSMLQDVRAGKPTEVREFNGWIVDTAAYVESLGTANGKPLDVRAHQTLIDLVEAGAILQKEQLQPYFSFLYGGGAGGGGEELSPSKRRNR